jgi:hypothetical protein
VSNASRNIFRVATNYQPMMRQIGLDAEAVFSHPEIRVWRALADRENCTLDATLGDGRKVRLHIKRYFPARGFTTPADDEANGFQALGMEQIPTAPLIGWGRLGDGRSFVITEDLYGYQPADKLIESRALAFDLLLEPSADLAAKLHRVGLHHRDLYLCHFFVKTDQANVDLKLIDAARVRRLPGVFTRNRWIVKDLSQFWYSMQKLPSITDNQRARWLARYVAQRAMPESAIEGLRRAVERKTKSIERHDARLNRKQPDRNVSIPT